MILSLQDKRTATEALRRNGLACLASEGMSEETLSHRGWRRLAYGAAVSGRNRVSPIFSGSSSSILGGRPSPKQAGSRMFTAPRTLDSSANQEGGP